MKIVKGAGAVSKAVWLAEFQTNGKSQQTNDLMGADFPLFRGPGQGCLCCDWSAHLFQRARPYMEIFWFVYSCFAPGWLKSEELFSKKVLSRNQMPRSWSLEGNTTSEWKAESFWKTRCSERQQMPQGWIECGWLWISSLAHLLSTPGAAALLLPVSAWPQAWKQIILFIHACISLVLAIAWSFFRDCFVCISSVSDPKSSTSGGSCSPSFVWSALTAKVSLLLCGRN